MYKWGTFIPLAGGMSIGNSYATGNKPEFLMSFPGFQANDQHLTNYWPDVPYEIAEGTDYNVKKNWKNLDFVSTVCPCAGLSMLNTGGQKNTGMGRGADAAQNQHMYNSANFVLEKLSPTVFWGENAPALYGSVGAPVAEKLYEIGKDHGYAFSIVKTNTKVHGIPQNRPRTFYFFWKGNQAPIMNYYNRPTVPLTEYLKQIPKEASLQNNRGKVTSKLKNHYTYQFMVEKFGKDWRKEMEEEGTTTVFGFIRRRDMLEDFHQFVHSINDEKGIKYAHRMIEKFAKGLGIWDCSVHYDAETINAVISRNMGDYIHPTKDRRINIREFLHLMGHPHDYELVDAEKNQQALSQNVPTCTARDWTYEVLKFIDGELPLSGVDFLKQDNLKQQIDTPGVSEIDAGAADFIAGCM